MCIGGFCGCRVMRSGRDWFVGCVGLLSFDIGDFFFRLVFLYIFLYRLLDILFAMKYR